MRPRVKFWRKKKPKSSIEISEENTKDKSSTSKAVTKLVEHVQPVAASAGTKSPPHGRRKTQRRNPKDPEPLDDIRLLVKAAEDTQERLMKSLSNIKDSCENMNNGRQWPNQATKHHNGIFTGSSDLSLTSPSNIVLVARFLICLSGLLIQPVVGVLLFVILFGMEIIAGGDADTNPINANNHEMKRNSR